MLSSGVQLLEALDIVSSLLGNVTLEKAVSTARDDIREGEGIAPALKRSGEFPPLVTHMISVGERSGEPESMLGDLSDAFDREVNTAINAMAVLEPQIVGMAAIVGLSSRDHATDHPDEQHVHPMTQRTQQPWATVLADDLRGLDTARRWGMAVGAAVLLLGGGGRDRPEPRGEAADRPYADLTAPLEVGVDRDLETVKATVESAASPTHTPTSLASSRPAAPTRP